MTAVGEIVGTAELKCAFKKCNVFKTAACVHRHLLDSLASILYLSHIISRRCFL